MSEKSLSLKWKRPGSSEYPKVWHTFQARDLNSENMVEYRIQDLPLDRIDDAFEHMFANYIQDEPIAQSLGGGKILEHYEDYKMAWRPMVEQRMPLVCFRQGSDDIVGINILFVISKEDHFMDTLYERFQSHVTKTIFELMTILYENFDTFEYYGVNEFLSSYGLSVCREYRGRNIGDHFLATRKKLCTEFGLKLTHTFFTSDFSNHNADKAGYKTNVAMTYEDVIKSRPKFSSISGIKSKAMTLKTLVCAEV